MYQGCPVRHKMGAARTTATDVTYASIFKAGAATKEGPSQDIAAGRGRNDEDGTAPSTIVDWSSAGNDIGNSVAHVVAPELAETCTE